MLYRNCMVKTLAQSRCASSPRNCLSPCIELKSPINSSVCWLQVCHRCELVTNREKFQNSHFSAGRQPTLLETKEKSSRFLVSRYIVANNVGVTWSTILQERLVKRRGTSRK
uniref:Uncharacterized protein n=1 Tax=Rhipicephalus zambeziensis TaxID=60191 RepID=A0A224YE25_9ACAR